MPSNTVLHMTATFVGVPPGHLTATVHTVHTVYGTPVPGYVTLKTAF